MYKPLSFLLLSLAATVAAAPVAAAEGSLPAAPVAARKAHPVVSPHGTRDDPYYWLRDDSRTDPEVLAYLNAENGYYEAYRDRFRALEQTLAQEMISHMKPDDDSVPFKEGNYYYYSRVEAGKDYPILARKKALDAAEEIVVDGNEEARRANYFSFCARQVSPNGRYIVYGTDTQGRYQCTLRIRDLDTGKDFADVIISTNGSVAWAADNQTFFYVENDPVTLLSTEVKRHKVGSDPRTDATVYKETDTSFYLYVTASEDKRYVLVTLSSTVSNEYHGLPADQPEGSFKPLLKRERDWLAQLDHVNDNWVIRHNWQAPNYRVAVATDDTLADRSKWRDVVPHSKSVFIADFDLFKDYLALSERADGLQRLRVVDWKTGKGKTVGADEAAYTTYFDVNAETDTDWLRYSYTSLTTPTTVYDMNMRTGERKLLKQQEVPGGFDKANYKTERLWVTARDGAKIPVSLVYHKSVKRDGTAPLLQYAYGSYGSSQNPSFNSDRLSLLDRGVVFALAHIRGGQDMGRHWYDQGKLLNKKNTFTDFIDVSDALIKKKYAAKDKLFAYGGSAGGLLMGAIVNLRPELYKGVLVAVPFVDVVTTMLDESIPLTTNEFDEWGNPKEKAYYDYMLSYSPYDNVSAQAYPAMLVTTGLHDSQVQYFEPAKWVAKLRATGTGNNPLLLRTNMEAGHGGKSGRYQAKYERAQDFAFLLNLAGITK